MTEQHLVKEPPSADTLKQLWQSSHVELDDFFNKRGTVFKELNLKEKLDQMSEEEKLQLLASDGKLIKRPIVTDGDKVTLGFKEEMFADVWGK